MSKALNHCRRVRPREWSAGITLALLALLPVLLLPPSASGDGLPGYAGSGSCRECHEETYVQWSKTPHARMRRSVNEDPEAVAADKFSPEIPFTKKDIVYAIGSHWIQKYLAEIGDTNPKALERVTKIIKRLRGK